MLPSEKGMNCTGDLGPTTGGLGVVDIQRAWSCDYSPNDD